MKQWLLKIKSPNNQKYTHAMCKLSNLLLKTLNVAAKLKKTEGKCDNKIKIKQLLNDNRRIQRRDHILMECFHVLNWFNWIFLEYALYQLWARLQETKFQWKFNKVVDNLYLSKWKWNSLIQNFSIHQNGSTIKIRWV